MISRFYILIHGLDQFLLFFLLFSQFLCFLYMPCNTKILQTPVYYFKKWKPSSNKNKIYLNVYLGGKFWGHFQAMSIQRWFLCILGSITMRKGPKFRPWHERRILDQFCRLDQHYVHSYNRKPACCRGFGNFFTSLGV